MITVTKKYQNDYYKKDMSNSNILNQLFVYILFQTLCITDDDNVWSWGDGDYGKLGRGGSDGCKIPMKVDSLAGLGKRQVFSSRKNDDEPITFSTKNL